MGILAKIVKTVRFSAKAVESRQRKREAIFFTLDYGGILRDFPYVGIHLRFK